MKTGMNVNEPISDKLLTALFVLMFFVCVPIQLKQGCLVIPLRHICIKCKYIKIVLA